MIIENIDNNGFEDQLTAGKLYEVVAVGANGYEIENDNGVRRYYGEAKFSIALVV